MLPLARAAIISTCFCPRCRTVTAYRPLLISESYVVSWVRASWRLGSLGYCWEGRSCVRRIVKVSWWSWFTACVKAHKHMALWRSDSLPIPPSCVQCHVQLCLVSWVCSRTVTPAGSRRRRHPCPTAAATMWWVPPQSASLQPMCASPHEGALLARAWHLFGRRDDLMTGRGKGVGARCGVGWLAYLLNVFHVTKKLRNTKENNLVGEKDNSNLWRM